MELAISLNPARMGFIMNFVLAILVFVLFGLAIGGGILMLIAGKPLLFIAALLVFFGIFARHGCASQ